MAHLTAPQGAATCSVPRGQDRRVLPEGGSRPLLAPPETACWALAEVGAQYVAYVRGVPGPVTLLLAGGEQVVRLQQFDPRRGEYQDLGARQVQGQMDYVPPDARDWVLVVQVESVSGRDALRAPGTAGPGGAA